MGRDNVIQRQIGAVPLFFCGLLSIPPVVLQNHLFLHFIQIVVCVLLMIVLSGKRFNPVPPLTILAGIILVSVFSPFGKVIFSIGPVQFTEGSLSQSLQRGFTVIGLVYLSKASVSKNLKLPGRVGSILSQMFAYFDHLTSERIPRFGKNWIQEIDRILLDAYQIESTPENTTFQHTTLRGWFFLGSFVFILWSLYLFGMLTPPVSP